MRGPSILAAILLTAAIAACTQPVPGGGEASEAPSVAPSNAEQPEASEAPSVAPSNAEQPEASATPYTAPGY